MRFLKWLVASYSATVSEWHEYTVPPFRTIRLKDGSVAKLGDFLMRRKLADGLWEHRRMTAEERAEEQIKDAW
jgi:hypothetical protein